MSHREGRVPAFLVVALPLVLLLTGCSTPDTEAEAEPEETASHIPVFWVEREVRVRTLDRMFTEGDSHEVIANTGPTRDVLFDAGVVHEEGDGYAVELDKDTWDTSLNLNRIDGALGGTMRQNEVTWCGEAVEAEEFVEDYMDAFAGTLDSHEAYEESVVDYVDCGTGRL
ncbi:hypothetical protein [Nocardiopsis eucommiae]|uniref:hypothetical protein n=1 Tax=Nocardiopsis eucommiae TaxID=2831970 RepID=UPI003D74FB19